MRQTLCCLCQTIIKLILLKLNSTSRYIDDLLNIDNPYFEQMVGQIYLAELQLNKANSSDTEAPFLDLSCSVLCLLCFVRVCLYVLRGHLLGKG